MIGKLAEFSLSLKNLTEREQCFSLRIQLIIARLTEERETRLQDILAETRAGIAWLYT